MLRITNSIKLCYVVITFCITVSVGNGCIREILPKPLINLSGTSAKKPTLTLIIFRVQYKSFMRSTAKRLKTQFNLLTVMKVLSIMLNQNSIFYKQFYIEFVHHKKFLITNFTVYIEIVNQ